jgi:hypothetical protein
MVIRNSWLELPAVVLGLIGLFIVVLMTCWPSKHSELEPTQRVPPPAPSRVGEGRREEARAPLHDAPDGNVVKSEAEARAIARRELGMTQILIGQDARITVELTGTTYKVTYRTPRRERPIPEAGYYAIVLIDAKTGKATVMGPP